MRPETCPTVWKNLCVLSTGAVHDQYIHIHIQVSRANVVNDKLLQSKKPIRPPCGASSFLDLITATRNGTLLWLRGILGNDLTLVLTLCCWWLYHLIFTDKMEWANSMSLDLQGSALPSSEHHSHLTIVTCTHKHDFKKFLQNLFFCAELKTGFTPFLFYRSKFLPQNNLIDPSQCTFKSGSFSHVVFCVSF